MIWLECFRCVWATLTDGQYKKKQLKSLSLVRHSHKEMQFGDDKLLYSQNLLTFIRIGFLHFFSWFSIEAIKKLNAGQHRKQHEPENSMSSVIFKKKFQNSSRYQCLLPSIQLVWIHMKWSNLRCSSVPKRWFF